MHTRKLISYLSIFVLFLQIFIPRNIYGQSPDSTTSSYSAQAPSSSGSRLSATSEKCITQVGSPTTPSPGPLGCTGGSNSGGGGPAGPCGAPPPYPSDIKNAILEKWGITLNLPLHQLQNAWKEFHEIDCTGILQEIKGSVVASWTNEFSQQMGCPGQAGPHLYIGSVFQGEWVETHIMHELTHIWQMCSRRGETNRLENVIAYDTEGGITNYSRTSCGFDIDRYNEDHAESISLYLNPQSGESTCATTNVNPFTTGRYPIHKATAQKGTGK